MSSSVCASVDGEHRARAEGCAEFDGAGLESNVLGARARKLAAEAIFEVRPLRVRRVAAMQDALREFVTSKLSSGRTPGLRRFVISNEDASLAWDSWCGLQHDGEVASFGCVVYSILNRLRRVVVEFDPIEAQK